MNFVWPIFLGVLAVFLCFMVMQGTIYIGWALGGIVAVIIAVLFALEVITDGGFWFGVVGIIILCLIFQYMFA